MNGQRGPKIHLTSSVYVPVRAEADGRITRHSLASANWPHGGSVVIGFIRATSWQAGVPEYLARLIFDAGIANVTLQLGHRMDAGTFTAAVHQALADVAAIQ